MDEQIQTPDARCAAKATEITQTDQAIKALVSDLVDANAKARPGLLARRADLVNLRSALVDELEELTRRQAAAALQPYTLAIIKAQGELETRRDEARQARMKNDAAAVALRAFMNKYRGGGASDEGDKKRTELQAAAAAAQSESSIAARRLDQARFKLESAKTHLEAAKAGL